MPVLRGKVGRSPVRAIRTDACSFLLGLGTERCRRLKDAGRRHRLGENEGASVTFGSRGRFAFHGRLFSITASYRLRVQTDTPLQHFFAVTEGTLSFGSQNAKSHFLN